MKIRYLDYAPNEVLLLKNTSSGKRYDIQYAGCGCFQYHSKGKIVGRFQTKYRYFNPNYWYNRASWLDDLGWIAFFKNRKQRALFHKYAGFTKSTEDCKKATIILLKDAQYASSVLKSILHYASTMLGVKLAFDGFFASFNTNWWESLIPVTCNGKKGYVLTWTNCD